MCPLFDDEDVTPAVDPPDLIFVSIDPASEPTEKIDPHDDPNPAEGGLSGPGTEWDNLGDKTADAEADDPALSGEGKEWD